WARQLGADAGFVQRDRFLAERAVILAELSRPWLALTRATDIHAGADEMIARDLATAFADYLKACKADERSLSTLPPGRLLLPGDLDGSPALT
ncbi:YcjX family protein, partial [Rhizobium ruizarguesonis]